MESANRNTLAKDMSIEVYTKEGLYIYKVLSGYRNDDNAYAETEFNSPEGRRRLNLSCLRISERTWNPASICDISITGSINNGF